MGPLNVYKIYKYGKLNKIYLDKIFLLSLKGDMKGYFN